jgi:hypothetical protein
MSRKKYLPALPCILFRTAAGIFLFPAAISVLYTSFRIFLLFCRDKSFILPLVSGASAYVITALLESRYRKKKRSNILYIAAHEISHALAAMFFLVKVQDINIGRDSGNVKLSGSNFIIGLAPYFLPLYAVITVIAYIILSYAAPEMRLSAKPWFTALAGFFLAFHFIHTADILTGPVQPDLQEEGGIIFSFPVIMIFSGTVSIALLLALGPEKHGLTHTAMEFTANAKLFYIKAYYLLKYIYNYISGTAVPFIKSVLLAK